MLTIVFGKVEEVRFFCSHSTLSCPGDWFRPKSINYYMSNGKIEEPTILPHSEFKPKLRVGYWREIKRSKEISEHLEPDRDFIQIDGKNYKILEKGQRLDDGAMLYYIDHVVDHVENKESYAKAEKDVESINGLNKRLENELRLRLHDDELAKKLPIQNQKPSWWERLWRWLGC